MNIYSNRRSLLTSGILGRDLLMDEIEKKVLQERPLFVTDKTIRSELMRQSCEFIQYDKLNMEESDKNFLSNYQVLIEFFQEICVENVSLDKLAEFDQYKNYLQHVEILNLIFVNYLTIMASNDMDDIITVADRWWNNDKKIPFVNISWIKSINKFEFYYDGILSRLDKSIIEAISLIKKEDNCILYTHLDSWFEKSISRLEEFGDLEEDTIYKFDFYTKTATKLVDFKPTYNLEVDAVAMKSMYGLYVDKKIEAMNLAGIENKDIAVVCASNSIFDDLSIFPSSKLFFNKEKPLSEMNAFKTLNVIMKMIENDMSDDFKKGKKNTPELIVIDRYIDFGYIEKSDIAKIIDNYNQSDSYSLLYAIIFKLHALSVEDDEKNLLVDLQEKIIFYKNIFSDKKLKHLLQMAMRMASDLYVEKYNKNELVEVVDFINSRGLSKKHLIILGFDKSNVPMEIKKDRFLDSAIRSETGMPNYKDRIAMQYHYWQTLIGKAEEAFVCYYAEDGSELADLSSILGIQLQTEVDSESLYTRVFNKRVDLTFDGLDDDVQYKVFKGRLLSPSKLKTYLGCKRKYFLKYIRKIKEPIVDDFKNEKREIGIIIHKIVEKVLNGVDNKDLLSIQKEANAMLKEYLPNTISYEYNYQYWSKKLDDFLAMEYDSKIKGVEIIAAERSFRMEYKGIILEGTIDRIDMGINNEIITSDYKTGKTPALKVTGKGETDFQVEFYKLLVENNFEHIADSSFIYRNIKECKIEKVVTSPGRQEYFLKALDSFIEDDGVYSKTHNTNECMFCPYKDICNK